MLTFLCKKTFFGLPFPFLSVCRGQFDEDVRDIIQIKLVHGSWKKEDSNKIHIDEAVKRHSNIQSITAHMPEAYGTHHSKMIVLFRHDDQAQYEV